MKEKIAVNYLLYLYTFTHGLDLLPVSPLCRTIFIGFAAVISGAWCANRSTLKQIFKCGTAEKHCMLYCMKMIVSIHGMKVEEH